MTPREIVAFIEARRLSLTSEKRAQQDLESELVRAGIEHRREVRLSRHDIIDFMIGAVGIEMKIKGQRREIYAQCARYCEHSEVKALVLATNAAMGMPTEICGKPVLIARLGIAWL